MENFTDKDVKDFAEKLFDMIFSKEVSRNFSFDWCDPDMDYEDDVYAYMQGFDKYMDREKIIHLQIDNIWK